MSDTSSTGATDDYGYEEEIKEFLKLAEDSKVNLEAWRKASLSVRSNRELLREEMQTTLEEVGEFVTNIEEQAKIKKFWRRTLGAGESAKMSAKEKVFTDALDVGQEVIKKLVDALTVIPEPIIDQPLNTLTDIPAKLKNELDPTKRLGLAGCQLVSRFAKILDEEGIKHNYPVPKIVEKPKLFRRVVVVDNETVPMDKSVKGVPIKDVESRLTSFTEKDSISEANRSPGSFLWHYACKNDLPDPEYNEIFAVRNTWQQEYVYTCKLEKIAGEGRAKKRSMAKQIAAANVLRQIISKSRKKSLPEEMKVLNEEEQKNVLALTCEFIEYGVELDAVCSQENSRPPIYTSLMSKPSVIDSVEMRCKALGFNAVGYGKDKEIAKRMAAKLVLDQVIDEREKSLIRKGQTTKLDWRM